MNNEEILKNRWQDIDKLLLRYYKDYKDINLLTQDNLQNILNSIKIEYKDISKSISNTEKQKLLRQIKALESNKKVQDNIYVNELINMSKNANISYSTYIFASILIEYIIEYYNLEDTTQILYNNVINNAYNQAIKEIEYKEETKPKDNLLDDYLMLPFLGTEIKNLYDSAIYTNTQEIYNNILINMQKNKELDINSKDFQNIIKKQNNRNICINEDKLSGTIVNTVECFTNLAYLEAGKDTNQEECIFVAEIDNVTTKMCKSMNGLKFKLNDWNKYYRYSEGDKRDVLYTTFGLEQGANLPPITNHFHWCRSTIIYPKDYIDKKIISSNSFIDNEGNEYIVDGKNVILKPTKRELEVARVLAEYFNKEVNLTPAVSYPKGIKTPDYMIDQRKFDLKEIEGTSKNVLDGAIKNKKEQADNFIFDITKTKLATLEIYNQVQDIYSSKRREWVNEIIIIIDNKVIKTYKR